MVWRPKVLSFNRKATISKKKSKSILAERPTFHKESPEERSSEDSTERKTASAHWPSLVLHDTRKDVPSHGPIPKTPNSNSPVTDTKEKATAWPSNLVLDDEKYIRGQDKQQPLATSEKESTTFEEAHKPNIWPSLMINEDSRKTRTGPLSREERDERSTRMKEQLEEREDVSINEEPRTSNHRLEPPGQLLSPNYDQLSYGSSSTEESEDGDGTGTYGSYTYDSTSFGASTLRTKSFDTRNLEIGCYADGKKAFNPTVPPREAESNNIVAALFHLTTQCYAPENSDVVF